MSTASQFKPMPTAERLRELLNYDPDTGIFTWKVNRGQARPGAKAGRFTGSGHLQIKVDDQHYAGHRLAILYVTGQPPTMWIDHVNGDPSDNRFANLREVTASVNAQNRRGAMSTNKSSGLLGVSFSKSNKKYRAKIFVDGKPIELGMFDDKHEAHAAYLDAKRRIHPGCTI